MLRVRSIAVVIVMSGCGAEPAPAVVEGPTKEPAPVVAAVETSRAPAVEVPEGPIDVFECDHYIEAYRRCIAGMSKEEQGAHAVVVEGQRVAWATSRRDGTLAEELAAACRAATAAAEVALPQCRGW